MSTKSKSTKTLSLNTKPVVEYNSSTNEPVVEVAVDDVIWPVTSEEPVDVVTPEVTEPVVDVQPEVTEPVVEPVEVVTPVVPEQKSVSKMTLATAIYNRMHAAKASRKDIIAAFVADAGLTIKGSATYYYTISKLGKK